MTETELRPGEAAVALPQQTDAGVYFIGTIHTPWHIRAECPKRGHPASLSAERVGWVPRTQASTTSAKRSHNYRND
jgi:hypothetical protein